ncbi:hypothetical protein PFISCL1PPCAC_10533, partial [Pristionchus fissidentatus]
SPRMVTLVEWPEITTCLENKRFELVLKNVKSSSRAPSVNDEELQEKSFPKNSPLNLLYIGGCGLERLSARIENCANLTNLVLKDNKLTSLPEEIGLLTQLKLIDVSSNELTSLPQSMKNLENLQSLDIAKNKITTEGLFDFEGLVMLHILEASHNELTQFPQSLTCETLVKLHTVNFSHNHITNVPFELSNVTKLKDFKMEKNELTDLPLCLGVMDKIRFLDLKGNPFKDTRFRKLANDNRAKVPSVLDYLRKKYDDMEDEGESNERKKKSEGVEESSDYIRVVTHHPNMRVKVLDSVSSIRGFLLTCVIRNVDFSGQNFRKFINLQTRLHSNECGQRTRATIGTHDMNALKLPLRYLALPIDELFITALRKKTPVSARELLSNLLLDSELARKREKRSQVNPVHRYLHLVKDLPLLACLIDSEGLVISLPPLTNSDLTKMTESTTSVLIEVSSADSIQTCYEIMDLFIKETRLFSPAIEIDQMRVVKENDDLLGEYPSRGSMEGVNLHFESYEEKKEEEC